MFFFPSPCGDRKWQRKSHIDNVSCQVRSNTRRTPNHSEYRTGLKKRMHMPGATIGISKRLKIWKSHAKSVSGFFIMCVIFMLPLESLENKRPNLYPGLCVCVSQELEAIAFHGSHLSCFLVNKPKQLSSWTFRSTLKKNIWAPKPHQEMSMFWAVAKARAPGSAKITSH